MRPAFLSRVPFPTSTVVCVCGGVNPAQGFSHINKKKLLGVQPSNFE